jgi:hypothetical protein
MPATVEKLPDEPIILVTVKGRFDLRTAKATFRDIAELIEGMKPPVYRITDFQQMQANFPDMLAIMKAVSRGPAGSPTDPRIIGIFVGNHPMLQLAVSMLKQKQFGGLSIPLFKSVDEALSYVRFQIANRNSADF